MLNSTFRVLIVEDELDFATHIESVFKNVDSSINTIIVDCHDTAYEILNSDSYFFDFITLDLNLPKESGDFSKSPDNGLSVLAACKEKSQGTPILVLTGSSTESMIPRFLSLSHNVDIWGEGVERPSVDYLGKNDLDKLYIKTQEAFIAVQSLSEVEISSNAELPIDHDRLIRIFTKQLNGVFAEVKSIGGGLSDSKVYSLSISNTYGNVFLQVVAKCGAAKDIEHDALNYDEKINILTPEVTPRKLRHIKYGAKSTSGVFYSLAADYESSFFKATEDKLITSNIRDYVRNMTTPWQRVAVQKRVSIKSIRESLLSDEKAYKLIDDYQIRWARNFEQKMIQSKQAYFHGDLHGENILIDSKNERATLIDYGDISSGSIVIDPLTLECSFLFHPSASKFSWPTLENAENWMDIDKYLEGCPIPNEIRFCRQWSENASAGNRDIAASLYAYSLRQLKYPETNKELALKLLESSRRIFENS